MTTPRLARILLVEDEPADVELVRQALAASKFANELTHVDNGQECLEYLRSDAPLPDLILLDLNMPVLNGTDTLKVIRRDSKLQHLPVVVMTSSEREEDVARSYELHANCYIRKPLDLTEFTKIVQSVESFWFGVVTLPPN